MEGGVTDKRDGVQSIDRAVGILRCFDSEHPRLGISQVARMTGLSTSTTHRLLRAMQDNGLVAQQADRRYVLGPLFVRLARSGAVATSLRDAAIPPMTKLRDEVEETIGLHALLPTFERAVLDQVESPQPLRRTYTEFGMPIPLTLGAPGKVMLAHLPWEAQEVVLGQPIPQATPNTPTDPDVIRRQLVEIRGRNYALSYSERTSGIRTVASAVFDGLGKVVGSISVSAPAIRMPPERMVQLGPVVERAAWEISQALGTTSDAMKRILEEATPPE
ncbi:MAG TPA: IclR family transcriptional regulator [Actinopolymorphaceae bacterium]